MKKELKINCPAKINLSLDVVNRRSDGYHNLEMIMQEINLCDTLTFSVNTEAQVPEIKLSCKLKFIPTDERNLIIKAAKLFFEKSSITASAKIHLDKRIPVGAGLGGGSSDAAGTLTALNTIFDGFFTLDELSEMAKGLGADVPFFLHGGCMLAEGIGEKLSPVNPLSNAYTVVAKPSVHVSTAHVYKSLSLDQNTKHPDTKNVLKALETRDIDLLAKSAGNVLETVTAKEYPEIEEYKARMLSHGAAYSLMSGSGSSVFGIFKDKESAISALEDFKKITKDAYLV